MKNNFIGILACLLAFLSGCSTATRYNTFVPMEQSCMLIYKPSSSDARVGRMDGQKVEFNNTDMNYIIPAGRHTLEGGVLLQTKIGTRKYIRTVEGPYGTTTNVSDEDVIRYNVILNVKGTVNLEPGKWYYFDDAKITVTPTDDKDYFADKDGELHHIDNVYYEKIQGKDWFYIYTFVAKEIEGTLGKTYFQKEYPGFFSAGVKYPNTIGIGFGPTYGFAYFSDPINVHFYGELGIWLGFGVRDYQFSKLADESGSVLLPPPGAHLGLTADFEIGKWGMGVGGGVIGLPISLLTYGDQLDNINDWWSPYVQLTLWRSNDFGSLFIDYYPGTDPLYSAFGIGWKWR